jgi:hypothetical protein
LDNNMKRLGKANEVMGVRFWRQDYYGNIKPRYEVYEVFGYDAETGEYWFKSRDGKAFIRRAYAQLNRNGFLPFCLNRAAIEQFIALGINQYANT